MKILQVNAVYRQLSTGSNVYELNRAFRDQGHTCVAAYSVGKIENSEEEWLIGTRFGQKLHALLSRIFGLQGYYSSFATRRLLRKMDEFQPDVVVLNNLHANYIHLPMLLKYLAKKDIPTVAVLHDCWFYTGKCCFYSTSGCDKWRSRCENCPAKKKYNKSWFFDFSRKMHKDREKLFGAIPRLGVVAVSDWLLTQAIQSPVFANAKEITRIHNWIDHKQFTPKDAMPLREKLGLQDKKVILSVAAVWENRKGLDTLLWMAEKLQPDEQLVVIGQVQQPLPEQIMHIGRTASREELIEYYSMADVFVQPSLEETFGKVTAEALSCGTPVVCYDSTANPELVGDGCGEVVPVKNKEAMLQQVRKILEYGKEQYTPRCRDYVENRFDREKIFNEYLQLFRSISADSTAASSAPRIKTIQINAVCDTGSTGRICKELNDGIMHQGHKGIILYGNGNSQYPYGRKITGKLSVKLHGFLSRVLGKNAAYSPIATQKAICIIRKMQPDVVHLHNLHGNYVNLKPLLKYLAKHDIPTVITLHDCWFFTGKCTHYTEQGCQKWQTGCYDCPKLKSDIPSFFFDRTAQMWKEKVQLFQAIPRLAVIGVSEWITEEGRKSPCFANAKSIKRIYNWIDLNAFCPKQEDVCQQYGLSKDKHKVICVGAGWAQNAGKTKDLIEMAKKLGENYEIILVGGVSCTAEMPSNVCCVGYIRSVEELAKLYSAADAYVHLSREDTFGKVIAEAMACGTPVVVYQATACPELVQENCGYVVRTGDVDAVVDSVKRIMQQGKATFSTNCVENVRRRFDKDMLIQETIDLYRGLCEK